MKFSKSFLFLLLLPFLFSCSQDNKVNLSAVKGKINLKAWDFENKGTLSLGGEWEFYWKELLSPQDFENRNNLSPLYFVQPASWNNFKIDGKELGGIGFATYRLVIDVEKSDKLLALSIPAYYNSYKLWVNGKVISQNGQVGASLETSKPQWLPLTKIFHSTENQIELVLQVSNFRHAKGGVYQSIELGSYQNLIYTRELTVGFDLIGFACLLLIGFFFLGLYWFWKNDKSLLYFSLFCILISYRFIGTGTYMVINVFPNFSWNIAAKIEYISMYIPVLLMFLFITELFPKAVHQISIDILKVITVIFSLLTVIFPINIYSYILFPYQLIILSYLIYASFVCLKAQGQKYDGAIFAVISLFVLLITITITVLGYLEILPHYPFVFQIGFLIFVFTQTFILSFRFAKAFHQVEKLKEETLLQKNKIENTNAMLKITLGDLQNTQSKLIQSEKMASLGQLTAGLAHEMNNPLNFVQTGIRALETNTEDTLKLVEKYTAIETAKQEDKKHLLTEINSFKEQIGFDELPKESRSLLQDIYLGAKRASEIVASLRDFSKSEGTDIKIVDIHDGLNASILLLSSKHKERIKITKNYDKNVPKIFCYAAELNQVFVHIFTNAIQAIQGQGEIIISTQNDDKNVEISFKDTGLGIDEAVLNKIFDPFFSTKDVGEGTGLGLSTSYGIIQKHGGHIKVNSQIGQGSEFVISIPKKLKMSSLLFLDKK